LQIPVPVGRLASGLTLWLAAVARRSASPRSYGGRRVLAGNAHGLQRRRSTTRTDVAPSVGVLPFFRRADRPVRASRRSHLRVWSVTGGCPPISIRAREGGTKVECFHTPVPVSASPAAPGTAVGEQTPDDGEDRSALEQQLAEEEERLQQAQRALSEQEANLSDDGAPYYYDWLSPYVNAVTAHLNSRDRIRPLMERGRVEGRRTAVSPRCRPRDRRPPFQMATTRCIAGLPRESVSAGRSIARQPASSSSTADGRNRAQRASPGVAEG
jgi:hypothetical protein